MPTGDLVDPAIHAATRIRRGSGVVTAEVDGEVVMMSVEQGLYYGLDDIGSDIWRRLEQPVEVGVLLDALSESYDADRSTIERDTLKLLDQLLQQRVIEVVP